MIEGDNVSIRWAIGDNEEPPDLEDDLDAWKRDWLGRSMRITATGSVTRETMAEMAHGLVAVLRRHGVLVVDMSFAENWATVGTSAAHASSTLFICHDAGRIMLSGRIER